MTGRRRKPRAESAVRRLATVSCRRRGKWLILLLWLVTAAVAGPLAGKLESVQNDDASSFLPAGAESARVADLQQQFNRFDAEVLPAVVVYERPQGITAADRTKAAADARRMATLPSVIQERLASPVRSADGQALQIIVPMRKPKVFPGDGQLDNDVAALRAIAAGREGLTTNVTGPAGSLSDAAKAFEGVDTKLLGATALVVIVSLLITYRSPILWIIPLVAAGIALVTAQAVNYLLARYAGLAVNGQSAGLLLVLVFGAGTDYALLLIARYREELRRRPDKHEAMVIAVRRACPAIIASAATVSIGLLCLLVSQLTANRGLGPVIAVGIVCGMLTMTTLLPALLVIVPRAVFWPFVPSYGSAPQQNGGIWARVGRGIARRPRAVWTGTVVLLGVMAVGLTGFEARGQAADEQFAGKQPDSVGGQAAVERHFDAGSGNPAVVIGAADQAAALRSAVVNTPGVAAVAPPQARGELVEIGATLRAEPSSQEAYRTIDRVRAAVQAVPGADALVGGSDASNLDVQNAARRDLSVIVPLVLAVILVILMTLLRAVMAPLLLIATVVLSFAATLGVSAVVFNGLFGFEGADASFPLYAFIFLVALGIDYNIFLMTRIREETLELGTHAAVLKGLAVTGGVITSAGVVLAATFSVLAVLPLVFLIQLGFAVAFGVLLDTLIVRSVLVPALAVDIGPPVWWPSTLDRRPRGWPADEAEVPAAPSRYQRNADPAPPMSPSRSEPAAAPAEQEELRRLRRENRALRVERRTLRRAFAILARGFDPPGGDAEPAVRRRGRGQ